MSEKEREKLWMAYLDGEMSITEASAFDETLSDAERERLAAEMRLESGIAENLKGDLRCPDAVWRRTQMLIRNQPAGRRHTVIRWWGALGAMAAAAVIVVTILGGLNTIPGWNRVRDNQLPGLAVEEDDVIEFAKNSEVPATLEAAQDYLAKNGVALALAEFNRVHPESDHAVKILGACEGECPEGTLFEILYSCCGRPVKVVVAQEGTGGARMIQQAVARGEVQETRLIGGYLTGVVGSHQAADLLDSLSEVPSQVV